MSFPTGPQTTVTEKGDIQYQEIIRPGCRKLAHYVKDMAAGSKMTKHHWDRAKVQENLERIYKTIRKNYSNRLKVHQNLKRIDKIMRKTETIPFLHLKKKNPNDPSGWEFDRDLTTRYLDVLVEMAEKGISFAGKCVLLTGAGRDSIGSEVLKGLLSGGAKVIVTTSRFSRQVTEYFQSIYQTYGSRGSELIVVPFNQGSKQDVDALVNYIYDPKGLNWDLDFVIPFAAIPENGREIDSIDSKSELAHRIMLTNLLRMLGNVKTHKQRIGSDTRPAQVILPLSPNHGTFGGDGLYSESKIALETLFNRWHSESWSTYLLITGAVIG